MVRDFRSMGAERERITPKPLHNFSLPLSLKWANQRYLKCMKTDDSANPAAVDHHHMRQRRRSPPPPPPTLKLNNGNHHHSSSSSSLVTSSRQRRLRIFDDDEEEEEDDPAADETEVHDGGIEAVREKIMMDLKIEADKVKAAILRGKQPSEPPPPPPPPAERPWNLRTRKGAVRIGFDSAGANLNFNSNNNKGLLNFGDEKNKGMLLSSPEKEFERPKFSLPLSKKEIEEDFMKLTGHKPARRPKKRQRTVQRQMDNLYPGIWLTEVTADTYWVDPLPETGKK